MIRSTDAIHAPARKETEIHLEMAPGPMTPPSAQNNLMSPAPIIPKRNRMIRSKGTTLPTAKEQIPAMPFCQIQPDSPRNIENRIQPLSTFAVRISITMAVAATATGKR